MFGGLTTIVIDGIHLIAWTLADGTEMISAYYPVGSGKYPDGRMLIGDRPTGANTRHGSIAVGVMWLGERLAK